MHAESHRSEEPRTVVQKLSFGLQTLKLNLVIVLHLLGDEGEGTKRQGEREEEYVVKVTYLITNRSHFVSWQNLEYRAL